MNHQTKIALLIVNAYEQDLQNINMNVDDYINSGLGPVYIFHDGEEPLNYNNNAHIVCIKKHVYTLNARKLLVQSLPDNDFEYVTWLDSDDIINVQALKMLVSNLDLRYDLIDTHMSRDYHWGRIWKLNFIKKVFNEISFDEDNIIYYQEDTFVSEIAKQIHHSTYFCDGNFITYRRRPNRWDVFNDTNIIKLFKTYVGFYNRNKRSEIKCDGTHYPYKHFLKEKNLEINKKFMKFLIENNIEDADSIYELFSIKII